MSRDLCPTCGRAGGKVERITLESLLREQRQGEIGDARHYVCMAPDCETVYYAADDSAVFGKSDLTTRFGMKEKDGRRPVCYCFDHSVESIHTEVQKTGQSTVLEDIQARMANPGCCCERTNPLGRCCLQSVRQAVRDAIESCGVEAGSTSECAPVGCASSAPEDAPLASNRSGVLAAGGSVVAAALEQQFASTAGLSGARVDYERKEAHVGVVKDDEAVRRGIVAAVRAVGFMAATNRIYRVEN